MSMEKGKTSLFGYVYGQMFAVGSVGANSKRQSIRSVNELRVNRSIHRVNKTELTSCNIPITCSKYIEIKPSIVYRRKKPIEPITIKTHAHVSLKPTNHNLYQ